MKTADKSRRKAVFIRLLKYFLRYKFLVLLALLLMLASNVFALLGPYLTGEAINAIAAENGVDFPKVFMYCSLMAIFYVASSALSYLLSVIMIRLSQRIIYNMRKDVFNKILTLPVGYLDKVQAGDLINRISYDIDTINASLSNDILQALTGIVTITGAFIGMVMISPPLLLVFIVTVPLSVIITVKRSKSVRPLFRNRSAKLAELNGFSEEMLSGLKTITAYNRENEICREFSLKNTEAVDSYYKADYYGSLIGPSVNFVNNLATVLISTAGAIMYLFGMILIGDISSFLLYARKFSGPINEYANIMGEIQSALAAAERVFRLLDAQPEPPDKPDAVQLTQPKGDISFNHVRFGYDKDVPVIKDLSFSVKSGQTVAIVGPTGAGKTTIVNLLMRFYDTDDGEITLDGKDIRDYTRQSLRAAFTMVLQDTWLFEGTIFDNIAYGKQDATEEEVRNAARRAHIDSFIESLPLSYRTPVTDGGVNLSKGQKQLITLARAMLSTAHLLILDEATSNVDTQTEKYIHEAMTVLMHDKTCFVIAHRLSTIRNADIILVIKDGDIAEKGTHDSLMQKNGVYAEIYRAQFE